MTDSRHIPLENRLRHSAQTFPYPPTPDLVSGVMDTLQPRPRSLLSSPRRLLPALILLILLAAALTVQPVRAAILDMLRLGAVRIDLVEPTPAPPSASPAHPTATPLTSALDLAGRTDLAYVQARVDFPIRLPAYPPDLGPPDDVFLQNLNGDVVILVWREAENPAQVRLALMLLGANAFVGKGPPQTLAETTVNGRPALWTEGPYFLKTRSGDIQIQRLISNRVLIWEENGVTYRLESDLDLAEALRIAESM